MTTIAFKQGVLAADTGSTRGGSRLHTRVVKIARAPDGRLVAACGLAGFMGKFLVWAMKAEGDPPNAAPPPGTTDNSIGVIFHPDGRIQVYDDMGMHETTGPYYALGSGAPEAMGAMYVGADAELAVRAAMHHDTGTYGEVIVLRHAEPLQEAAE